MSGESWEELRRRDEILEVMYWLRGEYLGEATTPADLQIFLGDDVTTLAQDLVALIADGFVEPAGAEPARYRLTAQGVKEGGRRFADDFADMQRPGHGECNRPGCACRQFGAETCVRLAERPV